MLQQKIDGFIQEVKAFAADDAPSVEQFRIRFMGRKGVLNDLFEEFKLIANDQKKSMGAELNKLKTAVQEKLDELKSANMGPTESTPGLDLSRPSGARGPGARHPLSQVRQDILDIFARIGFTIADGPEIEDDWHVFSGLNFPPEHPARDMQDTFFIQKPDPAQNLVEMLLRTHTSSVQVRQMNKQKPPIRIVMPGRVYRNEAISARAHCQFHQIEGLYIDEGVSFADMKQTLLYFTQAFFGKAEIRLRPSYFPFTEPSAELDVYWGLESEADHRITKGTGWLEILGCGMVDPAVLEAAHIDPNKYSGFAFGMGIERIAMLRYQVDDLRMFFENDVRFLEQFKARF
jgi:phenylalanyl-tRNA synthetase alpha chain